MVAGLDDVFARIDEFIVQRMSRFGPPGAVLAVTDREQTLGVRTYGYASIEAQVPVDPQHLFQLGSIGKSFTALALMQEREAGRIDLQQPVTDFLPWLELPQKMTPITLHHLLSHTSGLVTGGEVSPDPRWEVLSLRDTDVGFPPGTRFHYSNDGYKMLGFVLEQVTGRLYSDVIAERVLAPLGMNDSVAAVRSEDRMRTAVPYHRRFDDRPGRAADPWVPATWFESDSGDGSICASANDAATYARMILNGGRYPGGAIVNDESFGLMTHANAEDPDELGTWYGYGLETRQHFDHRYVGHYGGMVGHHCVMMMDMDAGFGVTLLHNANATPEHAMLFALNVLRAFQEGRDLPDGPAAVDPADVPNAAEFAGVYRREGESITLSAEDGRLLFEFEGEHVALEPREGAQDVFLVPHPLFDRTLLRAVRRGGAVTELTHGAGVWVNDNAMTMAEPLHSYPPQWDAYPGTYRTWIPWAPLFRIVLRQGRLFMLTPDDSLEPGEDESELFQLPNGSLRVGADEFLPNRMRFDTLIDGKAWRARFDNAEYQRMHF